MLFKWKKLYMLAEERLKSQREYIREIKKDKIAYDNIMDNLNIISNKYGEYETNIYFSNNRPYYIVETWGPDIWENDCTVELYTYKLEEVPVRISPVAELSGRLELNYFYKEKRAYIDTLNTMRELHQGHGSQILKRFIYIAKNANVSLIKGKLYNSTPIGLENLKKFYIKNGFKITNNHFAMDLKEPRNK